MVGGRPNKPVKRRAAKACERCRVRKVRCDIVHRQGQCTNCTLDEVQCIDTPGRSQVYKPRLQRTRPTVSVSIAPKCQDEGATADIYTAKTIPHSEESASPPTTAAGVDRISQTYTNEGPESGGQTNYIENHFSDFTSGLLKDGDASYRTGVPSPTLSASRLYLPGDWQSPRIGDIILPNFISPIKPGRCHQHSGYLKSQQALDFPPVTLRNALITSYVQYVYPQLPCVDIHHMLQAIATDGKAARVSILLLQAVLLAGSAHVEKEYLLEAGYQNRTELRQDLSDRVRLLYDFDCEEDRFILVQSLILMSTRQHRGDEVKHLHHWLNVAYGIAIFIGLNKDPVNSSLTPHERGLWRRLWWSFYIRDRMLALGLRHTPIIPPNASEMPDLTVLDFDIKPTDSAVLSMFGTCNLLRDLNQQDCLSEVCVAQLKLCHLTSQVLSSRHKNIVTNFGCTTTRTLLSIPKTSDTNIPEIQSCSQDLNSWFQDLPAWLKYNKSPRSLNFSPGQDLLVFHCALLNMCYYSLVCILHRPWPPPIVRALPATELHSQRKARHGANAIMTILNDLHIQDMVHLLPTTGLTFLVQASVTYLCDSTSKVESIRQQSRQQLQCCLEFVEYLLDVHATYALFTKAFLLASAAKLFQDPRFSQGLAEINAAESQRKEIRTSTCESGLTDPYIHNPALGHPYNHLSTWRQTHEAHWSTSHGLSTEFGFQDSLLNMFEFNPSDLDPELGIGVEGGDFGNMFS